MSNNEVTLTNSPTHTILSTSVPAKCPTCGTSGVVNACSDSWHLIPAPPAPEDVQLDVEAEKQQEIDISNLRFYSAMAHDFRWQTDVIHYGVITQTLQEIADRLALLRRVSAPEVVFEFSPSPCGHSSQYAYTENGGKNIVCLVCERRVSGKGAQPEITLGVPVEGSCNGEPAQVAFFSKEAAEAYGFKVSPAPVPATPEPRYTAKEIISLIRSPLWDEEYLNGKEDSYIKFITGKFAQMSTRPTTQGTPEGK